MASDPRSAGVWTLAGDEWTIDEPEGPATLLVPTEQVALLVVDLPLASRAKRLEALPFAVEDRIADPLESVHLVLGAEIGPKRYLAGVVRHDVMAAWALRADEAGLGHAAIVPDALALPVPGEGEWAVDLGETRALVRTADGAGFACPAPLLRTAWDAAGRPRCVAYGAPLPAEMAAAGAGPVLAGRMIDPALDLRQGAYPKSGRAGANVWRRLGWVLVLGAAAHTLIAAADTVMLRVIADRRAAEAQALVASMGGAPGTDLASMLPQTAAGAPQIFLPLLSRVSGVLAPLAGGFTVRAIDFQGSAITMDVDSTDPGLAARLTAAFASAQVKATVAPVAGGVRITASAQ